MKKIVLFILLLCCYNVSAQTILDEFPEGQSPYKNGEVEMFAEMQQFLVENNLAPCKKNEFVLITLKIDENGRPFLIKRKSNEKNIEKNKCAFEMAGKALGSLKNWQAAEVKGKKVTAYYQFLFIPNDFFENFEAGYVSANSFSQPQFPGGKNAFDEKLSKYLRGYLDWSTINSDIKVSINFDIDTKGKLSNVEVQSKIPNSEYLHEDIKFSVMQLKEKWIPAKIKENPIVFKYKFDYTFSVFHID